MKTALFRGALFAISGLVASLVLLAVWDVLTGADSWRQDGSFVPSAFPVGFAISSVIGATMGFSLLPEGTKLSLRRVAISGGLFGLPSFLLPVLFRLLGLRQTGTLEEGLFTVVCVVTVLVSLITARIMGNGKTSVAESLPATSAVVARPSLGRSVLAGLLLGAAAGALLLGLVVFFGGWVSGAEALNFGGGHGPRPRPLSLESAKNATWIAFYVEIFFGWAAAGVGALTGAVAGLLTANFKNRFTTPNDASRRGGRRWFHFQVNLRKLMAIFLLIGVVFGILGRRIHQSQREDESSVRGVAVEREPGGFLASIPVWGWLFQLVFPASATVVDFDGELTSHEITNEEIKLLAESPRVRYVAIQHAAVTDEGLTVLRGLRQLTDLRLSNCDITGTGFRHLRELPELRTLDISRLRLTDEGLSELAGLTQLKQLSLSNVAISDAGARELSRMKNLDSLSLRDVQMREERLSELQVSLGLAKVRLPDSSPHYVPREMVDVPNSDATDVANAGANTAANTVPTASPLAELPPLAIAPFDAAQARDHQMVWAKHLGVPVEFTNSSGMTFRLIPPGEFLMGMTQQEVVAIRAQRPGDDWWMRSCASSTPLHSVRLTRAYYMGVNEVTQQQYERVSKKNPSAFSAEGQGRERVAGEDSRQYPAEMVSFGDAAAFCNGLSRQEMLKPAYLIVGRTATFFSGDGYRLPTEAEWEWACRAGTTTYWSHGAQESSLPTVAWFDANSAARTHAVGQLAANPFGLHDMHGNVGELCQDGFDTSEYARRGAGPTENPQGPAAVERRAVRGGSFSHNSGAAGSPFRADSGTHHRYGCYGFRVVVSVRLPSSSR